MFLLKTFWSEVSLILLTVLNSWPAVLLIIFLRMQKEIRRLIQSFSSFINTVRTIDIKNLVKILRDPEVSEKVKLKVIERVGGRDLAFRCNRTNIVKNATGDGTLFQVPFENCCINSKDGVFTAGENGICSINWWILLKGITSQTTAVVRVDASSSSFRFPTNNLANLKNDDGTIVLYGTAQVQMDMGDTVQLAIEVGASEDNKTVHLAEREEAYFSGYLVQV